MRQLEPNIFEHPFSNGRGVPHMMAQVTTHSTNFGIVERTQHRLGIALAGMRNTVGMRDEVTEIALTAMAEKLKAEKIVCRLNKGKLFFTYHVNARHNNRSLFIGFIIFDKKTGMYTFESHRMQYTGNLTMTLLTILEDRKNIFNEESLQLKPSEVGSQGESESGIDTYMRNTVRRDTNNPSTNKAILEYIANSGDLASLFQNLYDISHIRDNTNRPAEFMEDQPSDEALDSRITAGYKSMEMIGRRGIKQEIMDRLFGGVTWRENGKKIQEVVVPEEQERRIQLLSSLFVTIMGQIDELFTMRGKEPELQNGIDINYITPLIDVYIKLRSLFLEESTNGIALYTRNTSEKYGDILGFDKRIHIFLQQIEPISLSLVMSAEIKKLIDKEIGMRNALQLTLPIQGVSQEALTAEELELIKSNQGRSLLVRGY